MLLFIACCIGLISLILCVIFGQVTVRKLRKNPETKGELGMEFIGGMDIFNVGVAFTLPRKFTRLGQKGPLRILSANADLLYKHTTRFDRILARVFIIPATFSLFGLLGLSIMEKFGFLKH
jgi:hypothetical protein